MKMPETSEIIIYSHWLFLIDTFPISEASDREVWIAESSMKRQGFKIGRDHTMTSWMMVSGLAEFI